MGMNKTLTADEEAEIERLIHEGRGSTVVCRSGDVYEGTSRRNEHGIEVEVDRLLAPCRRLLEAMHAERARAVKHEAKAAEAFAEVKAGLERERVLREQLATVATGKAGVWFWQGDGHDDPESLSCPVVMSATTLRGLLARAEKAEATIAKIRPAAAAFAQAVADGSSSAPEAENRLAWTAAAALGVV